MKFKLPILLFFIAFQLFAQEKISTFEIYKKNHLAYKKSDGTLFTGIEEFKKNNGHLVFEKYYEKGYLTNYKLYYNTKEQLISSEEIYYIGSLFKQKKIEYTLVKNEIGSITYFDKNGKKELNEVYKNDTLIYSCQYLNNKKHGKEFCITKKCDNYSEYYENGKKIKS